MINFSDGKSDGLMLAYVKDGIIYPVAVKKDEFEVLDIMIGMTLTQVAPIIKKPLGKVEEMHRCKWCGNIYSTSEFCCPRCQQQDTE